MEYGWFTMFRPVMKRSHQCAYMDFAVVYEAFLMDGFTFIILHGLSYGRRWVESQKVICTVFRWFG